MKMRWIDVVLWLGVLLVSISVRSQNHVLVIEGGTLIDGTGGAPLQNAVVVIEGSRIKSVGTKGRISYPPNARIINAEGKTILPGLIDCHMHSRGWDWQMYLHYGVTTVYDTKNITDWIVAQREALQHGKIKGPRLFVTGGSIGGTSISDMEGDLGGYAVHAATPEEARAAVRSYVSQGVDMIKTDYGLNGELIKAVVDEAAKEGVVVVGHSDNIRVAALSGMKFMEHTVPLVRANIEAQDPKKLKEIEEKQRVVEINGKRVTVPSEEYMMDTELFGPLIKLMVQKGVYINPTLMVVWADVNPRVTQLAKIANQLAKDPAMEFVPAYRRQAWSRPLPAPGSNLDPQRAQQLAEGFKKIQEFTGKYAKAGGTLVAGSDGANDGYGIPGIGVQFEMESLVDAGATPMQAIMAATKWPAELAHKDKDLGTVEAGKVGDIVVIAGDPLKDIAATQNVSLVIKDGEIIDTTINPKFTNPIPRSLNFERVAEHAHTPNPGPGMSTMTPRIARQGDPDLAIQITGEKFTPQSIVRFDNTDLKTQFVSDSKLAAIINSSLLQKVGTYAVTVLRPGSGGGTSNSLYFIVNFKY
jgi:imidazolonepropionase-like amidohydrolase